MQNIAVRNQSGGQDEGIDIDVPMSYDNNQHLKQTSSG